MRNLYSGDGATPNTAHVPSSMAKDKASLLHEGRWEEVKGGIYSVAEAYTVLKNIMAQGKSLPLY